MTDITFELDDRAEKKTIGRTTPLGSISTIVPAPAIRMDPREGNHIVDRHRRSWSTKWKSFCKRYIKLLVLILNSIIPDLKSFKCWQVCILILFAAFNVVFSVLVSSCHRPTVRAMD
jgi:hypothetical protein